MKGCKIYAGKWKDGKPDEKGAFYYPNTNEEYRGKCKNGKREGNGVSFYACEKDKIHYNGNWRDGKQEDKGMLVYLNHEK